MDTQIDTPDARCGVAQVDNRERLRAIVQRMHEVSKRGTTASDRLAAYFWLRDNALPAVLSEDATRHLCTLLRDD